jgi:hypothetical protein
MLFMLFVLVLLVLLVRVFLFVLRFRRRQQFLMKGV